MSWEENVQENRKKNQEDFVPGGKCPGRIVKKFGRIIEEENVAGGKCLGGFCNSVHIPKVIIFGSVSTTSNSVNVRG